MYSYHLLPFLALLLLLCSWAAGGDWDGYVDHTFFCPARTTCAQVCVATVDDCPVEMQCNGTETLCADGNCALTCDTTVESPCEYECAPVACRRVVDFYDSCTVKYESFYTSVEECGAEEDAVDLFSFREPGFLFFFSWISAITVLVLLWTTFNQRLSPVAGSTCSLEEDSGAQKTQTGYTQGIIGSSLPRLYRYLLRRLRRFFGYSPQEEKHYPKIEQKINFAAELGTFLYTLVLLTLFGFQLLLAVLTIFYYIQQEAITRWNPVFEDEEQVLKAFIITWLVGFVWTFAMRWNTTTRSVYYRRAMLRDASIVAVFVPSILSEPKTVDAAAGYIAQLRAFLTRIAKTANSCMAFIFSDITRARQMGTVQYCNVLVDQDGSSYFIFNFRRYVFDNEKDKFVPGVYVVGEKIRDFDKQRNGLSSHEVTCRRNLVGPNAIRMKRPNFLRSILKEFAKLFYVYQAFMVWTWFPLWYYYMAIVWTIVITTGGLTVAVFYYRNEKNLYRLTYISGQVSTLRNGDFVEISPVAIVPGDVLVVKPGLTYCDMVLLSSDGLLVDESSLTGESTPVQKTAIDPMDGDMEYSKTVHKKHTILAGTIVLDSNERGHDLAVVTTTGSYTTRGELLRNIFSYERHQFKFDTEVRFVIMILFFYAIFGFSMVVYFIDDTPIYAWFYGMFVVGTILPPLLPTVFTVSVSISDNRLSENGIACTNNEAILVAGKVQVALFDKTGTLTNQGLDFISARSMIHWDSDQCDGLSGEMALGMATCHGLARSKDGALIGNPVDKVMFAASGGAFDNVVSASAKVTDVNGNSVEVVKNYDFCNDRMTQSVIVKKQDKLVAFVKGSGENIKKLCTSESLPGDFDASLQSSAKQGVYQISMASKVLPADTDLSKISRDDVEKELTFAGVVNFKNVLREDTPAVLRELEEGSVRTVMVTGDSLLTGIRIAKESGMIKPDKKVFIGRSDGSGIVWVDESDDRIVSLSDSNANSEIAITGEAWEILRQSNPKEAASLTQLTRVFGRCTPNHKVAVVTSFIELGKITMMCGDGSNDCGALKTAHVGIALSDSEASIVAPFTSLDKSITSVSELLREGRCALASALASYKYMIMYGQIETINQLMNAYFRITFADWCWVFMDGIWTITLAFSLALSRPENKLAPTRPTSSLLGPHTLSSALGVLGIQFIFTVIALATLFHQDWFQCRKWNGEDVSNVLVIGDNYESEVIFLVTGYQYISSALAFSFGYEWRMAFYLNYVFVILFLVYTFFQWWITVRADSFSCIWRVNCVNDNAVRSVTGEPIPIQNPFNTTEMPTSFRWMLIGIMAANTIAVVIWEFYIVNGIRKRMAAKRLAEKEVGQGMEETMIKVESSMALEVESQHTP